MHRYQLRLQSRNATAASQLRATGHQDLETAIRKVISAAVKRHHEEEIQLIKDSLAKTVRLSMSNLC